VLLIPLIQVLDFVLSMYWWVIIISVILSWLVQFGVVNTQNRAVYMIGSTINQLVEPPLRYIRRYLPSFGNLDLSPIVLLLAIFLVRSYLQILIGKLAS
jgi:YggT family protein